MLAESLRHHLGDLSEGPEVFFQMPDGSLVSIDTFRVENDDVILLHVTSKEPT